MTIIVRGQYAHLRLPLRISISAVIVVSLAFHNLKMPAPFFGFLARHAAVTRCISPNTSAAQVGSVDSESQTDSASTDDDRILDKGACSLNDVAETEPSLSGITLEGNIIAQSPTLAFSGDTDFDRTPRRACYCLHGLLLVWHLVLLVAYTTHVEHRITVASSSSVNVLTTVLSISLQAFYTLYTAILVFFTQRLSLLRNFSRRQKLTSIHDASGAWIGIGSALFSLWDQTKVASSPWSTLAITTYLLSVFILHITSSSLIQFQTFNATSSVPVPTTIGWPNESTDLIDLDWQSITTPVSTIRQLPILSTAGLSNTTVYDTLSPNSGVGNATVNATTVNASCGLLHNVTGYQLINSSSLDVLSVVDDNTAITLNSLVPPGKDQVWMITTAAIDYAEYEPNQCTLCQYNVFFMLSTAMNMDPSVRSETVVPMNWSYYATSEISFHMYCFWGLLGVRPDTTPYSVLTTITEVYFAACSLSTSTTNASVDAQSNQLQETIPSQETQSSQWPLWNPKNASNLDRAISTAAGAADLVSLANPGPSPSGSLSVLDVYMMSLLGLNASAIVTGQTSYNSPSTNPTFTLSPYQLESAIALMTAEAIWMAGQLGEGGGGFASSTGQTNVTQYTLQWRLNINLVPLIFATVASLASIILAVIMTGAPRARKTRTAPAIKSAGVLELLWLAVHLPDLREGLEAVEEPTVDNLRAAGMFDVCLADGIKAVDRAEA
ncbi:hypothetical protein BV22DRAFT_1132840 [Leucogyrophana mollusca]|uniref:Uncharacterized protein n=1 Tax=Leucogyrophana mollusca TaxID=85980 RepID=A0ACB8B4Q1_9AGAM|nr:hypothetical protein BV22DRAFT_1132840 [Leucogyrophana mollusca]